jgi:hypothetical protein
MHTWPPQIDPLGLWSEHALWRVTLVRKVASRPICHRPVWTNWQNNIPSTTRVARLLQWLRLIDRREPAMLGDGLASTNRHIDRLSQARRVWPTRDWIGRTFAERWDVRGTDRFDSDAPLSEYGEPFTARTVWSSSDDAGAEHGASTWRPHCAPAPNSGSYVEPHTPEC